jgi:hypothetical protein
MPVWKKSAESNTAIHVQSLPSNRARVIGLQEQRRGGNFIGRLRPALSNPLAQLLEQPLAVRLKIVRQLAPQFL